MKATSPELAIRYQNGDASAPVDLLADYVDAHPERLKDFDKHWNEVMDLAKKYGFINQAVGGVAILCTHRAVYDGEGSGAKKVAKNLRMNHVDIPDSWEDTRSPKIRERRIGAVSSP